MTEPTLDVAQIKKLLPHRPPMLFVERLTDIVEKAMLAANYSPAAMREANRHDLRLMLRRLALTGQDARRILGLFRRILWRLKH